MVKFYTSYFLIGILLFFNSVFSQDFITTWSTNPSSNLPGQSCDECITIPTTGVGYNYNVDWDNDGTYDEFGITGNVTHDFGVEGTYTIRISGSFPRIYFNNNDETRKIISIDQWGSNTWTSFENAFYGCIHLDLNATDAPDLSGVTSLSGMFRTGYNSDFNSDLSTWNVSTITDMSYMFEDCHHFNGDISGWDVSNVTDMAHMLSTCGVFNCDISGWDVSNVTDMSSLFLRNSIFNANLSGWNVSEVTNMSAMFMFADAFNQNIGGWNTSKVNNMSHMFAQCDLFDQDISGWDVSNVTDMSGMFTRGTVFDQDISGWDVGNVVNMQEMFRAAMFNQDIREWNTRKVTNMLGMFNASMFNQDVGDWNIQSVTDMSFMFDNSAMNLINYDSTLIKWLAQADEKSGKQAKAIQNSVPLGVSGLNYCNGTAARSTLINDHSWTIVGDAQNCVLPVEMVSFKAEQIDDHVLVTWSTSSEISCDYFSLEQSFDGKAWEFVEKVDGSGNASNVNTYSIAIYDVHPGVNIFRLQQFDFDGNKEIVGTVSLLFETEEVMDKPSFFPNPVVDEIQILGNAKRVHIMDIEGHEIENLTVSDHAVIPFDQFGKGMYFLVFEDEEGETFSSRLI
ncbi:MAG: BspA family leucine-rich repeat surface protein, partial [Flavobacteriales bacterium]|nr:BspA family leucine-rich repeat surface protein [Flavobacteriales bacterium]